MAGASPQVADRVSPMRKSIYPYMTRARRKTRCAETGAVILPGERMVFHPAARKVYAMGSEFAANFEQQSLAK